MMDEAIPGTEWRLGIRRWIRSHTSTSAIGGNSLNARSKADAVSGEEMSKMTAGLPLPPGFKLPF